MKLFQLRLFGASPNSTASKEAVVQPTRKATTTMANIFFSSLGHFVATTFGTIRKDLGITATFLKKEAPVISGVEHTIGTVVSLADPAAAPLVTLVERAIDSIFGQTVAAVSATESATQNPVNVTLDADAVQEWKTLIQLIESQYGSLTKPSPMVVASTAPAAVAAISR